MSAEVPMETRPAPPRRLGRWLLIGGAAAVALGLAVGLWARPGSGLDTDAAERTAPAMPIEVARPPPPEPIVSDGKLEVLSPDMSAPRPALSAWTAPPAPALPREPSPAAATSPEPPAALRADTACASGTAADRMVCENPELAAADRQLSRAYRRAVQAGVPAEDLRADQQDWMDIREDAALHSRRALASVYRQRIDELNAAADEARDDADD